MYSIAGQLRVFMYDTVRALPWLWHTLRYETPNAAGAASLCGWDD